MRYLGTPGTRGTDPGYEVEDGVIVDEHDKIKNTNRRRYFGVDEQDYSPAARLAEELEWAARSGPVTVRRKA